MVPTTNFILKWNAAETGAHSFDENLSEVALITKDAFEPTLPLSVVVHIDYRKAPLVIQRFGDVKRLVEQTLDPMVAAYFKNIGQTRTLIQLLQDRSEIQDASRASEMQEKFDALQPRARGGADRHADRGPRRRRSIEQILTQLRSRQIAEEQVETYSRQEKAAVKERELREAEARARQQQALTESRARRSPSRPTRARPTYARAQQQAAQIQALAGAEAEKIRILGEGEATRIAPLAEAEAERAARVGIAQAMAIEEQVRAYGGPQLPAHPAGDGPLRRGDREVRRRHRPEGRHRRPRDGRRDGDGSGSGTGADGRRHRPRVAPRAAPLGAARDRRRGRRPRARQSRPRALRASARSCSGRLDLGEDVSDRVRA